jgi:transcriptional regulator with XRE-family HTH domain
VVFGFEVRKRGSHQNHANFKSTTLATVASAFPAADDAAGTTEAESTLKTTKKPEPKAKHGRGSGVPDPVDVHVGARIRMRRLLAGMNQETLAQKLGLTFQQVQKYEGGANRVSASRLAEIADALGVTVSYFFADLPSPGDGPGSQENERREMMRRPETLELIRLYYGIADQRVRGQFLDLVKSVAQSSEQAQ